MSDKIHVVEDKPSWQRYDIKTDWFTIEQIIPVKKAFKRLMIYDVGDQALQKIATLFNLKIQTGKNVKWVSWEDLNTHIEVVIYE
jgi:hypothetical protein